MSELDELREERLADLKLHWGTAYDFWTAGGRYHARHKSGGRVVRSASDAKVREWVRADYFRRKEVKD